jgi:hypothetical protein
MKPRPIPIRDKKKKQADTPVELQTEIRHRAYEIYQQKGCQDGDDLQDWLQAEEEALEIERQRKG